MFRLKADETAIFSTRCKQTFIKKSKYLDLKIFLKVINYYVDSIISSSLIIN